MVRRNARGTFASSVVFPGGRIEPEDASSDWQPLIEDFAAFDQAERARRIGAIRETWEETSILVGATPGELPAAPARTDGGFREYVEQNGVRLRLDSLATLAHWITPVTEPRRFDTVFYVAPAPNHQVAVADGSEIDEVEWVNPAEAARLARSGESPIIFPTLMNLERLAESAGAEEAIAAALARPPFTVQPVIETNDDGSRVIVIPLEAGYRVTRFSP